LEEHLCLCVKCKERSLEDYRKGPKSLSVIVKRRRVAHTLHALRGS